MDRETMERTFRPVGIGLVVLITLILLLGSAIRDPRPHDIPVGLYAPPPVADQITQGFAQNAPGAFAFRTYGTEAEALQAIDQRDVVASLIVGQAGPRLVVAGAAGDAVSGGVTAAFTNAFRAQGTELTVEVVHPFGSGDPQGIVLFFLLLATLISSTLVGAFTVMSAPDRRWTGQLAILGTFAVCAGALGPLTASWLASDYGAGIAALMALVALLAFTVAVVIAACARLAGPAGVALGVLFVVLLGLVSSGGPLGSAFLPDTYRAIALWLPVDAAYSAIRGALYFDGAGIAMPVAVLGAWAVMGIAGLAARDVAWPVRARAAEAAA